MKSQKKKYILFQKPHTSHLLFLVYFIVSLIKQGILNNFKRNDNLSVPILKLYIYDIGDFFALIPYLILQKKIKKNKNEKTLGQKPIKYIYYEKFNKESINNKRKIKIYIFLISLIDFIAQISTVTYYLIRENQTMEVKQSNLNSSFGFNIFFLFLFSRLILLTDFYKHHYFSIIIIIISILILATLDLIQVINDKEKEELNYAIIYVIIRILVVMFYSIEDVIAKVLFLYYYVSPYFLLLVKALIQFIYLIIFSIPLIFVKYKNIKGENVVIFSMIGDIFENKLYYLAYAIYLINSFFYNIINFIIIDTFSANHSAIAKIFENFGILILNLISEKTQEYLIIRIIIFILLIVVSFIFNEFLVINICGLGNDTKLFLDYKEKQDLLLIRKKSNEITEEKEDQIFDSNYLADLANDDLSLEMSPSSLLFSQRNNSIN